MSQKPARPPRLQRVFAHYSSPIYFVTFGTHDRKQILAKPEINQALITFAENQSQRGTTLGRYVILPDHIHLFIRLNPKDRLGPTIGYLKKALSVPIQDAEIETPHWQPGFFDHLLRSANSYSEKWDYVRNNPVRAGLATSPEEWPYAGEPTSLSF